MRDNSYSLFFFIPFYFHFCVAKVGEVTMSSLHRKKSHTCHQKIYLSLYYWCFNLSLDHLTSRDMWSSILESSRILLHNVRERSFCFLTGAGEFSWALKFKSFLFLCRLNNKLPIWLFSEIPNAPVWPFSHPMWMFMGLVLCCWSYGRVQGDKKWRIYLQFRMLYNQKNFFQYLKNILDFFKKKFVITQ